MHDRGGGWWYDPATGVNQNRICMTCPLDCTDLTRYYARREGDRRDKVVDTVMAMREVK